MEKRPKDRLTPPALGAPPAPRLAIEANKLPIRGAYLSFLSLSQLKFALPWLFTIPSPQGGLIALMALLALTKLALLRLFTLPSVSHRDIVRLFRTFSTGAAPSEGAAG